MGRKAVLRAELVNVIVVVPTGSRMVVKAGVLQGSVITVFELSRIEAVTPSAHESCIFAPDAFVVDHEKDVEVPDSNVSIGVVKLVVDGSGTIVIPETTKLVASA